MSAQEAAAATVLELDPEDYCRRLLTRNGGFVTPDLQRKLAQAVVLVAGCGSVGGAVVQPLTRLGVRRFVLTDVGSYELNNLNRQHATISELGENKAVVAARRIHEINPHADVQVVVEGVTRTNASELVDLADVIVDGVDVTTASGLAAKMYLHEQACQRDRHVVAGWDMAGRSVVQHFDYRHIKHPYRGALTAQDLTRLSVWEAILRLVPTGSIPAEMLAELRQNINHPDYAVPQLTQAADLFGVLGATTILRILQNHSTPRHIIVDAHQACRPRHTQVWEATRRPIELIRLAAALGPTSTYRAFTPSALRTIIGRVRVPKSVPSKQSTSK